MEQILTIAYINTVGQTGLSFAKQSQLESFIVREKIGILNLQEIDIDEESFSNCSVISSSFNIISNNSLSKYGTASIIKSDLSPQNIQFDGSGHIISFDAENMSFINV